MKKILVIGGTGFIGHHCLKKASKLNASLFSLSLKKPKKSRKIKKVKYFKLDFTNHKKLKKLKNDYDYVINAGGYYTVSEDKKKLKNNINKHLTGLKNIINFLDKKKLRKFIQIGSSLEYDSLSSPLIESMTCRPKNYYGKIKLKCTKYALRSYHVRKYPISVIRLFSLYGDNQNKGLIFDTLYSAKTKNFFPTSLGNQRKDFCHIDDVIDAIFKILFSKKTNGEIFNVGYGKPFFVKEVISYIVRKINYGKPKWGAIKLKNTDNLCFYPSIEKIKKQVNWRPKINLETGINNLIKNYK